MTFISRFVPFDETGESRIKRAAESPEDHFSRLELSAEVAAALRELKAHLRLGLLLKYVEGMSYEEIARALDCAPGTIASRLNRGHKALANRLAHWRGAVK